MQNYVNGKKEQIFYQVIGYKIFSTILLIKGPVVVSSGQEDIKGAIHVFFTFKRGLI